MRKLFGEIRMTWLRVIIFALISGVYTGLIKSVPFLDNTSFQDIAIYLECWFIFAIIIIMNCEKWWEAALKCFVFFLISQPIIYLVQVPFQYLGWQIFMYYKRWFVITCLTLPGGALGFLIKKNNWLGTLILAVPTGYFAISSMVYLERAMNNFPYHLLSGVFCIACILALIIYISKEKKYKIALGSIAVICMALVFVLDISF